MEYPLTTFGKQKLFKKQLINVLIVTLFVIAISIAILASIASDIDTPLFLSTGQGFMFLFINIGGLAILEYFYLKSKYKNLKKYKVTLDSDRVLFNDGSFSDKLVLFNDISRINTIAFKDRFAIIRKSKGTIIISKYIENYDEFIEKITEVQNGYQGNNEDITT